MVKKRFNKIEIHDILKEYENGASIQQIIDEYGICQATFYNWRSKFKKSANDESIEIIRLKEENDRLKRMFAEISMKYESLKGQLKKKEVSYKL